jgi:hypothetical protein
MNQDTMTLRTVYFEAAAGRGAFAWQGEELDQTDRQEQVHREFAEIVQQASADRVTEFGRVVTAGGRLLVEIEVAEQGAARSRPVTAAIVADRQGRPGEEAAHAVAEQAAEVLTGTGLIVDVPRLTKALQQAGGGTGHPFRAPVGSDGSPDVRKTLLIALGAVIATVTVVTLVRRILL